MAATKPRRICPAFSGRWRRGESITITKRGKPIAVLSPAQKVAERDVSAVIAEFRAYSMEHARKNGSLGASEINEIEEGRDGCPPLGAAPIRCTLQSVQ